MKKILLLVAIAIQFSGLAQKTINDYQYIVVPVKFDFQKQPNEHRLSTFTKAHLEKMGFIVFYEDKIPVELINNRCGALYANLERESAFLATKMTVSIKDCQNNLIFKSAEGKSKEKSFAKAYAEALDEAMISLYNENYSYNGNTNFVASAPAPVLTQQKTATVSSETSSISQVKPKVIEAQELPTHLYAQPIKNGYQLVDNTPKVVLKIYKTSNPDYFTAQSDTANGVLIKKNNDWFFEYYQDDQPVSEKLLIKF
ncbi:hypothetical protein GV828_09850 [Flavobacterium sp. NST-5]|uniref:BatD protein n=1 Tax=Flavobacterium ichthyis TaxID=2698827 RepID=A0ABW9ZDX3_9FLAO|nr:hypothetical protein [Flavobacterium ichthyis]NBL65502.1 hypothetical protein [Flavobacterium ichthyis]